MVFLSVSQVMVLFSQVADWVVCKKAVVRLWVAHSMACVTFPVLVLPGGSPHQTAGYPTWRPREHKLQGMLPGPRPEVESAQGVVRGAHSEVSGTNFRVGLLYYVSFNCWRV